ncbi:phytase [Marinomonas sp.]|uniref:phytase n=1 Tax=Marinomonas sp. TaxID=1904862 RepID=UPI003BAD6AA4
MPLRLSLMALAITSAMASSAYAATPSIPTELKSAASFDDIADAAVWTSPNRAQDDLLITTLEGDGLVVFDDQGKVIMRDDSKEVLGADVRYGLKDGDKSMDLLAVGLPDDKAFAFYRIDRSAAKPLTEVGRISTNIAAEAVCLYQNVTTGETTVTGVSDGGDIVQYKLQYKDDQVQSVVKDAAGKPVMVRHTNVGGELSACVVDDQTGTLYVGEQNIGIWAYGADAENIKDRRLVDAVAPLGHLEEVEGLDLVYQANGEGYLLVADEGQGFLVYGRKKGNYLTRFNVTGVEEAKIITASTNAIWVGNTEADQPVYEKIALKQLTQGLQHEKVVFNHLRDYRDLTVQGVKLVAASGETDEVSKSGDAADDPAFWLNPEDASKSLIIATNKKGGLMAYDLNGKELQFLKGGKPNNVDLRTVKDWDGKSFALAAASNRELNTIALYKIGGKTPIEPLNAIGSHVHPEQAELLSNVDEVYGLCMYQAKDGTPYVFVNGKNGVTEQWRITPTQKGMKGDMVRTLKVETQPEGCVADDVTGMLYVGEEDKAIWSFQADEEATTEPSLFAEVDGKRLVDDIEGITLYQNDAVNYLIASSQGNNTYAIFDLANKNQYLGSFAIIGDDEKGVDGSSDTDGIHAVSANLGAAYPQGIFIAQDWNNLDAQYKAQKQNFKIVNWQDIEKVFKQ